MHVKKGDQVQVISGNDRGKTGEIMLAMPKAGRVVVQGINLRWRHKKPTQQNPKGERVQVESAIHHSNVKPIEAASSQKKAAKAAKGKQAKE